MVPYRARQLTRGVQGVKFHTGPVASGRVPRSSFPCSACRTLCNRDLRTGRWVMTRRAQESKGRSEGKGRVWVNRDPAVWKGALWAKGRRAKGSDSAGVMRIERLTHLAGLNMCVSGSGLRAVGRSGDACVLHTSHRQRRTRSASLWLTSFTCRSLPATASLRRMTCQGRAFRVSGRRREGESTLSTRGRSLAANPISCSAALAAGPAPAPSSPC